MRKPSPHFDERDGSGDGKGVWFSRDRDPYVRAAKTKISETIRKMPLLKTAEEADPHIRTKVRSVLADVFQEELV